MPVNEEHFKAWGLHPSDFPTDTAIKDDYIVVVTTRKESLFDIFQRGFENAFDVNNMACPQQSPRKKRHKDANSDTEDDEEEEEIVSTYELWQNFLHSLTLHGFRFIFEDGPKIRRIFWLVILILAVMMLLLQSKKSIQKYFERPITTTVQVEFLDEIIFPAVSICNFNLFPYYLINGTIGEKVRSIGNLCGVSFSQYYFVSTSAECGAKTVVHRSKHSACV